MSSRIYKLKELVESFSVRAKDVGGSENLQFLGVSNEKGITESKYAAEEKGDDYKIIEKGCFAYNPYRINVGSIAYVEEDIKGLISPAYVLFKVKPNKVLPQLLLMFLKSSEGLSQIKQHARGTVRQALRFEDLCRIEITLPDYDKQTEIIDRYKKNQLQSDSLSTELIHQLTLVKQLRQSFLREAMQGKLTADFRSAHPEGIEGENSAQALLEKIKVEKKQLIKDGKLKKEKELSPVGEDEMPFEIPEGWVWCRLGEICNTNGRIGWKGLSASEYKKSGPMFLSVHSLNYGDFVDYSQAFHISQERYDESPEIMLQNDDILICKDGAGIGKLGIIKDLIEEATINSSLLLIRRYLNLDTKYIYFYLLSPIFQSTVNDRIMGATTPHLYQRDIVSFCFALPPLSEQQAIVSKLDEQMLTCDELEASIRTSQQQNEMLLREVLREALEG